ncbi:MAG: hypothetical protein AAF682_01770 [Planctomycetota bacterium]
MTSLRPLLLAGALAAPASAQQELLAVGDILPGAGAVTGVQAAAVADAGAWAVVADLASGSGDALVRDGAVFLQQGDPVGTGGASLERVLWAALNAGGDVAWSAELDVPGAMFLMSALGFGSEPLVLQGAASAAPGVGAGTFYLSFGTPLLSDARTVLTAGAIEDPSIPGFAESALLRFDIDAAGQLAAEAVLVKATDPLAGGLVEEVGLDDHVALAAGGDYLYRARVSGSPSKDVIARNATVLAEVGGPAPISGAAWSSLDGGVALNDQGDHAFAGTTVGGASAGFLLTRNGAKVVAAGDVLPDLAPHAVLGSVLPRIEMAADGTVAWMGTWSAPADNVGLFLDDRLVLREGVSQILDRVIASVDGFRMSPDGELLGVALTFTDGSAGAFLLAVSGALVDVPGCVGNPGALQVVSGLPAAGAVLSLTVDQGQAAGVTPFLAWATAPAAPGGCGVPVPGLGEVLLSVAAPNPVAVLGGGAPWTGGPFAFQVPIPFSLYGETIYAQGLFADLAGVAPGEPFRLTGGLELAVGL